MLKMFNIWGIDKRVDIHCLVMDIHPLVIQFVLLMPYLLDSSYLDKIGTYKD